MTQLKDFLTVRDRFADRFRLPIVGLVVVYALLTWLPVVGASPVTGIFRAAVGAFLVFVVPGYLFFVLLDVEFESILSGTVYIMATSLALGTVFAIVVNLLGLGTGVRVFDPSVTPMWFLGGILIASLATHGESPFSTVPDIAVPLQVLVIFVSLPVLAVFAGRFLTWYGIEFLNFVVLIGLIAIVAVLLLSETGEQVTRLGLVSVSLALLLHTGVASNFLWGWDIQQIYWNAERVLASGIWDYTIEISINGLPMMTVYPVVVSNMTTIPLEWVYKLGYMTLYTLFPAALYLFSRIWLGRSEALFAALVLCIYVRFFMVIPGKQHFAQLFMAVALLASFDPKIENGRPVIVVMLLVGLLMSHYGTAYLFGAFLTGGYLVHKVVRRLPGWETKRTLNFGPLTLTLVVLYLTSVVAYFASVSGGTVFRGVMVFLPYDILTSLVELLQSTEPRTGVSKVQSTSSKSVLKRIHLLVYVALAVGSGVGFLREIGAKFSNRQTTFPDAWLAFSVPVFGFAGFGFFIYGNLGIDRVIDLVLFVLAPYLAITIVKAGNVIARSVGNIDNASKRTRQIGAAFIVLFLLFNSGLVYAPTDEDTSFATNSDIYYPLYNEQDTRASTWVTGSSGEEPLYVGRLGANLMHRDIGAADRIIYTENTTDRPPEGSYTFFWTWNLQKERIGLAEEGNPPVWLNETAIGNSRTSSHRVYTSGQTAVYY